MQLSNVPAKFQKPFGVAADPANIRVIPVTTTDPNAASQTTGWAPNSFVPEGAGGLPPDGRDMAGLDLFLSSWAWWLSAGGLVQYDATFQAAVGGYPQWAVVGSVTHPGTYWQSTADANLTNPDTGGAGWTAWPAASAIPWGSPGNIGSITPNGGMFSILSSNGGVFTSGVVNASDLQINGVGFTTFFGVPSSYNRLPNGGITQGGRVVSGSSHEVISFPGRFPNTCTIAMVAGNSGTGERNEVNVQLDPSFTFFTATTWRNGSLASAVPYGWIAWGN